MPWGFWAMFLAPFLDVLAFLALEFFELEEAEFFPDAPLRTAGDPRRAGTGGCTTRGFKFFEVFFELGLVVFFMRAGSEQGPRQAAPRASSRGWRAAPAR